MGAAQILAERAAISRRLAELDDEAALLADCDRRADANFLLLDALEAGDESESHARPEHSPRSRR